MDTFYFLCCLWHSYFQNFAYLALVGLSCGLWDIVPRLGIESGLPGLGVQSYSTRNSREFWIFIFLLVSIFLF